MKKRILAILAAFILTAALTACGGQKTDDQTSTPAPAEKKEETVDQAKPAEKEEAKSEPVTIKVGLTGTDSKVWNYIKEEAAKENIKIELVFFDAYNLPNAALNDGELDLNAFQHHFYLDKEVEELGYQIEAIADTVVAPLGLYSKQITSIDQVADGAKVAIPEDVTNGGRALVLLQQAGLIKLDDAVGKLPTIKDITENPKNLQVIELAATNIPPALDEVQLAAINSGVATDAGYIPAQDALVLEDYQNSGNLYVNVIAARSADKDRPEFKKIIDIYHTDAVKKIIEDDTKGSSIPVW